MLEGIALLHTITLLDREYMVDFTDLYNMDGIEIRTLR